MYFKSSKWEYHWGNLNTLHGEYVFKAVLLQGGRNYAKSCRADQTSPARGKLDLGVCNDPLALTEDNRRANQIATNHSGQKLIKEPAKKRFTSNYMTQIVPGSTHMYTAAIYFVVQWQQPSLPGLQYLALFFPPQACIVKGVFNIITYVCATADSITFYGLFCDSSGADNKSDFKWKDSALF